MARITTFARGTAGALVLGAAALLALSSSPARAQDEDPPTRVARLAYVQGAVSFEPAGTSDWVAPPLNRPLTTGDQLWVDRDGRAELALDGSALRLGEGTSVSFLNLADGVTQVQLASGRLTLRVRRLDAGETYEIDTPNLAFSVQQPGVYRLTVDPQAATTSVVVRDGQGEVTGGGAAYSLYGGDADTFAGTDSLYETQPTGGYGTDDFDAWSDARDARWDHSPSARYVAPDVVGYQDLDDHGTWTPTPDYGYVWVPRGVAPGWAPYSAGHWAYVAPWGYTWVDDQPWGYAPFHYGRWVWTGAAWGWVPAPPPSPGVAYVRPVYAPALVAWVGAGAAVAWFALGPREVYVPTYPVSRTYVNNINVSNTVVNTTVINNVYNTTIVNKTTNITNVNYVNRRAPGAIVAASSQALAGAVPIARARTQVYARTLAAAPVRSLPPPIVPTRQAVLGTGRATPTKPPAALVSRPVVARTAPPPPAPSFEQRQKAIQSNGGRPLSMAQVRHIEPPPSARPAAVRVVPRPATVSAPKAAVSTRPAGAPGPGRPAVPPPRGPSATPERATPGAQPSAEQQRQQQQQQAAERARQAEQHPPPKKPEPKEEPK